MAVLDQTGCCNGGTGIPNSWGFPSLHALVALSHGLRFGFELERPNGCDLLDFREPA